MSIKWNVYGKMNRSTEFANQKCCGPIEKNCVEIRFPFRLQSHTYESFQNRKKKRIRPHAWKFESHSIYCRIENCVQLIDCEIRQNAPKLRILFRFSLSSIGNWSIEKETFDQLTRITWLEKRRTCAHAQRPHVARSTKKLFQSTFKWKQLLLHGIWRIFLIENRSGGFDHNTFNWCKLHLITQKDLT